MNKLWIGLFSMGLAFAMGWPAPAAQITAIDAGDTFGMALREDGRVYAWGDNLYGQLGDGTYANRSVRTPVSQLSNIVMIVGGYARGMALKSDGTVWNWGVHANLLLGVTNLFYMTNLPVQVTGLPAIAAISGGSLHSLALDHDGRVWAWGYNASGQLGDGTGNPMANQPVQAVGLSGIRSVSAGAIHSLALQADGTVLGWGANAYGQLGLGPGHAATNRPVAIPGLAGVRAVKAGNGTSLAVLNDGTVWGAGLVQYGSIITAELFMPLTGLTDVAQAAAGSVFYLVLKTDGTVWGWGSNDRGQLGIGTTDSGTSTPVRVHNLSNIVAIDAGDNFGLALDRDGVIWSWGQNHYGELANGQSACRASPAAVAGLGAVRKAVAGKYFSLALLQAGTVSGWGRNYAGELGTGGGTPTNRPTPAAGLAGITNIAAGDYHSLALGADGTGWGWGANVDGQLGIGTNGNYVYLPTPMQGAASTNLTSIAAGSAHSLVVYNYWFFLWLNTVCGSGNNASGQLGLDTLVTSTNLFTANLGGWLWVNDVAAGANHSLALNGEPFWGVGSVWAWGRNESGQLGVGTYLNTNWPTCVAGIGGATAIAGGMDHSLAVVSNDTVWAWGGNSYGQVGPNPAESVNVPVQVAGLTNMCKVAAGSSFSLALSSNGTVWAWGVNRYGQLGNGTFDATNRPVQIPGLANIVAISAGESHGLAVDASGVVWAWGADMDGQLGDGVWPYFPSPARAAQSGALSVRVIPAGASWRLADYPANYAGATNGTGNYTLTNAAAGSYTVSYADLAGYRAPEDQSGILGDGDALAFTGRYRLYQHFGDFDGDRRNDPAVYNMTSGVWRVMLSASGYGVASTTLGGAGWLPVSGDFDNDRRSDPGIFQEASGTWAVMLSGQYYLMATAVFGGPGCVAVPGDFDGDGKADPAVHLESTGGWSVMLSGLGYGVATAVFGGPGNLPVSGDFDGDRKTDLALYNETNGLWQAKLSLFNYAVASGTLGGDGWYPVIGDFDGDRLADPAVYQETTGTWQAMLSGMGYPVASGTLGGAGFVPVSGDFDGDGKTDVAVYQESSGLWQVLMSGSGYAAASTTFGGPGRMPLW